MRLLQSIQPELLKSTALAEFEKLNDPAIYAKLAVIIPS